jgi:mRNA interferase MazF
MENDFDRWNEIKKRLASNPSPPPAFPKTGEVWMCTLGKNLGREQNGGPRDFSRPVLVIKKFNNEIFWVVPLSTKQKPLDFYFNYDDPSGTPVAAVLAQLRLVSINRFRRNIYVLPATSLNEVRARLRAFLS